MPDDAEDIDIGPLTLPELHSLARDATMQLRRFWTEILARQPRHDGESIMELLDLLMAVTNTGDSPCRHPDSPRRPTPPPSGGSGNMSTPV
jgi:hypothetical protein